MGPAEQHLRVLASQVNKRYVGRRGNTSAPCVFIGEAPGADEETQGIPFVGYSGSLLMKMAGEAGFAPNDYWVTNTYKVRPPENDLDRINEIGVPVDAHEPVLLEELYEHKPSIIVALGATALGTLCPDTIDRKTGVASISKWRGSLLQSPKINWPHYVVPAQHPAFILREWAERPIAVLCLAKAWEEFDYLRKNGALKPLPSPEILTLMPAGDVRDYLREAIAQKEPTSNDIETIYGKYLYTISIARSNRSAISFSLWDYAPTDLVEIWRLLDTLLRNQRSIGQNYVSFDCHYLESFGFSPCVEKVDDTLVRHHVLWPEFEHKLQFLGMQYTRMPYWKDEGKLWSPKEGKAKLQKYNCLDTIGTYQIFEGQEIDFQDRPHLIPFYRDYEMRLNHALFHVENRGLLIDRDRLQALRSDILRRIDKTCDEVELAIGQKAACAEKCTKCPKNACVCGLRTVYGLAASLGITKKAAKETIFNVGSADQLIVQLAKRGIKAPKKRGKTKQTVDEIALLNITINNNQEPLPKLVLDIRELNKIRGTYVDTKLTDDNLLLSSYRVTGTKGGRRSSNENIFGFGTNNQNLPKHSELGLAFRECIVARPGMIFVEGDQKGAEDWIVQAIIVDNGGSRTGLDELLQGINRHRRLAAFLFGKPERDIDKAGMHYYAGKKTRHAANYSMREDTMSGAMLKETGLNMPPAYCAWLLKKFHEYEPSIREIYHKWVELQLENTRLLTTPLGRERFWFGLRPASNNAETFREAYAWIPQSTVGDNTGMCLVYLTDNGYRHNYRNDKEPAIVQDNHDAVTLEVPDNPESIMDAIRDINRGFDRILRFQHGTEVKIPIEFQVGYNQKEMKTCPDQVTLAGLSGILAQLQNTLPRPHSIITG